VFLAMRALNLTRLSGAILLVLCPVAVYAAGPEIANVFPDFPSDAPKIITGEGFDPESTELWTWAPESDEATIKQALANLEKELPPLPTNPPEGAQRTSPLDVEPQVIVARLKGSVLWTKTADGFSKPLLFNAAKPCWISQSKATPGTLVYVFGFGLRPQYAGFTMAITGAGGTYYPSPLTAARGLRTKDSRLVHFEVPKELPPGPYAVYVHNSSGGSWGWRKAGDLELIAAPTEPERVFRVREFGAKGDGLANDHAAICQAIQAAKKVGGGVVFFTPGTYLTDETISVPSGVNLRGANRQSCILQGYGDALKASRMVWNLSLSPPTAVVRLHDRTGIESLTVQGATWKGQGGYALVDAVPNEMEFPSGGQIEDVTVVDCCLRADDEDPRSRRPLYRSAFHVGPVSRRIKLLSNEIFGSANCRRSVRTDIIDNTFHGGATSDVVTLSGKLSESLVDANRLTDTPGRICLGMGWHNYIRYNEIHQAFRGTWENAEEVYLVHGGVRQAKTIGFATGASPTSLVDQRQSWKPGLHQNSAVLIISGRGFGQYRRVLDNTANTLTLAQPWNVTPDATTEYVVSPMFIENAFFANLNNTPCRLSLWLDCVANLVEMHRDDHAKGMDLWGEDGSKVDEDGIGSDLTRFYPAYYNMFVKNWMDGSALWLGTPGAKPNNAHRGYPSFGNFVTGNRIREPHTYRTGFNWSKPYVTAGVSVIGGSGRAGTSHTIVADNFLASTYTGISVDEATRKTFLLRNEFDHVDEPIDDQGARTVMKENRLVGPRGSRGAAIPDVRSQRDLPAWQPRAWKAASAEKVSPLFFEVEALKQLVSDPQYCIYPSNVESADAEAQCQDHLRQLFTLLQDYEHKNGQLPKAAFFPRFPSKSADSLAVLLGAKAAKLLVCPTCSPELRELGLNYAWNQKVSGRKLSVLTPETWLLMDCVGSHYWLVDSHNCGHRGKVNVLYADGSVKQMTPYSTDDWQKSPSGMWKDWARE
jgi:prepilin-type processing-associated H-X9-DG protein